jgi:peptidoglycan/LPS O-acetylase OafA/YrhL
VILSAIYFSGAGFTRSEPWVRWFRLQSTFYSALAPLSLLLMGASLLLIAAMQKKPAFRPSSVLVALGRASLTFLIVHVVVIREAAVRLEFWKTWPALPTLAGTAAVLVFFALAAAAWRTIEYRYGFEWLLRRIR